MDTNEQWEMINVHVKGLSNAVGHVILVRDFSLGAQRMKFRFSKESVLKSNLSKNQTNQWVTEKYFCSNSFSILKI